MATLPELPADLKEKARVVSERKRVIGRQRRERAIE